MALVRNIAGVVPKLGLAAPDSAQNFSPDDGGGGGGGSYYDPIYPEPMPDPVRPSDPMPVDYGGGGGGPMPPEFYSPDGAGGNGSDPGPSDQQPVYPILPIREFEEIEPEPREIPNTAAVTNANGKTVNIAAIGALAGVVFMMLGARPKGALGTITYLGGLGLLYMQLRYTENAAGQSAATQ